MNETVPVLLRNPAFAGEPRILEAVCHDRSPFITCVCRCGEEMHFHETQLDGVPQGAEVATACKACRAPLIFPPGYLFGAFQQMRDEGWIA